MALQKILSFYAGSSDDPREVREVRFTCYKECKVNDATEDIVLYELPEPQRENNNKIKDEKPLSRFDLIVRNVKNKDYGVSLRRFVDNSEAQQQFALLREKLPQLLEIHESFPSKELFRNYSNCALENPSWSVAHIAVALNLLDILRSPSVTKYLDTKCEITGKTPLHLALELQNAPALQALLDQGARVDVVDNRENSPFHYAIKTETKSFLEMICRAPGAATGINQRNLYGETPLQAACMAGLSACVETLLKQGADVNSASFSTCTTEGRVVGDRDLGFFSERQMRKGGTPLHWVKSRASLELMIDIGCDLNARNSCGDTALHVMASKRRLESLIWLLIEGANVNARGCGGDTPLHVAVRSARVPKPQDAWMLFKQKVEQKNYGRQKHDGLSIVQILLAFGADLNSVNTAGDTPRHIAAVMASNTHNPRLDQLLFVLHAVGAKRCAKRSPLCTEGCSPDGSFDGVPPQDFCKDRMKIFDEALSADILKETLERKRKGLYKGKRCRALSVDGGGVKGLVTLRTLKCLEEVVGQPIFSCVDWVIGTSAGGISTCCLACGHSLDVAFRTAFRLKEKFIVGPRPYNTEGLEEFFKQSFGGETKFSDIKSPRFAVTAVNAEVWPTRLKLFRNYVKPRSLLEKKPEAPDDEFVWSAARATGAAPTFFKPYKQYLDGAIISNNPTLDLITEITEYNAAMKDKPSECYDVDIVLSVGGGMRPTATVGTIDALQLDPGLFGAAKVAYSVGHLMKFAVEQIAEPDGRHVDRARAWCYGIGVPYARLQPVLSQNIPVNESDNRVIAKILWETMACFKQFPDEMSMIAELLRDEGKPTK
ncbi:85/88 kDa calcium-independent phospholipase A2 [Galendromus occidentalis]|uniref:phospholipase A2 n=1 Tax=Galendromus occidentalis TaxID=34638 RepID=A0AAJ6QNS4_9ACAR|nr:85/88 kDa calcium-independent phospholipase A2 [Galendromus occidentalis]XP_018494843.1 85/88 kDa calcium-independent phospholipase A2 [Galendromus occidentalis]